jgi:hypothetical protein
MTIRHQRGHLRCTKRKNGPSVWEFLWRENDATGKRLRRTATIGTIEQFPTEDLALIAVNGLRVSINEACNHQRERFILFGDLVDHYKQTELCDRAEWYSEATKVIYSQFLQTSLGHCVNLRCRQATTFLVGEYDEGEIREMAAKRLVIDSLARFEIALASGFRTDFRESLYRMIGARERDINESRLLVENLN